MSEKEKNLKKKDKHDFSQKMQRFEFIETMKNLLRDILQGLREDMSIFNTQNLLEAYAHTRQNSKKLLNVCLGVDHE